MASIDWNGRINAYLQRTGTVPAGASDILGTLGAACQSAVERFIGRTFDNKTYTEAYDGNGRRVLFLRHDPVVSITSVTVNGGAPLSIANELVPAYPSNLVAIEPTKQGIILTDGSAFDFGARNVIVSYTAGLTDPVDLTPPEGLLFAVTYWAALFFRRRDRVGESSSTIGAQVTAFANDIPKDIRPMFMSYMRPLIPC